MRRFATAVAALAVFVASPAAASAFLVTATGNLTAVQSANPVTGLGFGNGASVVASWRIDLANSTAVDVTLPTLIGPQRLYIGAVSQGRVRITGAGGVTTLTQTPANFGAILVLNDYIAASSPVLVRVDQVSLTAGTQFAPGFTESYAVSGPNPGDAFLRQINFGTSLSLVGAVPPGLLSSVDRPDFAALLAIPQLRFFNFAIARGTPANDAAIAALPSSTFVVQAPQLTITAVPEPQSWALLVAGFALTGAALRRRAATLVADTCMV